MKRWLILLFLLASPVARGRAAEIITRFHSDITVTSENVLEVRETIAVIAENKEIRRGIYRDFPTTYKDRYGNTYNVGFRLVSVECDGRPAPYHTKDLSNGIRIYIGDKDIIIPIGPHTYVLTYTTTRQIGFFESHDELYWNVTGNGWVFPIEKASANVYLPANTPLDKVGAEGYTGPQGSVARNYSAARTFEGFFHYETTKRLGANEGLTIVATFPKGIVREPTAEEKRAYFFDDNKLLIPPLVGFGLVLFYYCFIWFLVGRDPRGGTIIPLYEPPKGMSPAAVRYIREMGYDPKAAAAAFIHLAVTGHLTIEQTGKQYSLTKKSGSTADLPVDERELFLRFFQSSNDVLLDDKNHATIGGALKKLQKALSLYFQKNYFLTNKRYFALGVLVSLIGPIWLASLLQGDAQGMVIFMCLWLTGWTFGVLALVTTAFKSWKKAIGGDATAYLGAFFMTLFSIPFIAGECAAIFLLSKMISPVAIAILAATFVLHFIFFHLLKKPTLLGRKVLDQIEGFRLYLSVAEADHLNFSNPPEKTPALFEKFLPYALALDVEQAWAEKFSSVLNASSIGGAAYSPLWYRGNSWSALSAGTFASSLGGAFSSAISSSATPPGSSSGGGGGGSSGGGGGGGGGGGW